MGEVLVRDRLARLGIDARVHSAGLMQGGHQAAPDTVKVMAKRGFDLSEHRSTHLTPDLVEAADLVIGMAKEHVREAAVLVDGALARTFTLRELVRRAEAVGARQPLDDGRLEPLPHWLARVSEGRRATDLMGDGGDDDVPDPMGLSKRQHDKVAAQVTDLVDRFVALAFPVPGADRP